MPLSETNLQTILQEYDRRRLSAESSRDERVEAVYQAVPEIRRIDGEIESFGMNAMKSYLQNGHDSRKAISDLRARFEALHERKRELLLKNGYAPDVMEVHYTCPLCSDTGFVDGKRCRCLEQRLIDAAYAQSGIREQISRCNRSTFDPSLFSDAPVEGRALTPRENILRNYEMVNRALSSFDNAPNFLFSGTPGTGKTFLSCLMAKEVLDRGCTVLYLSAYEFFRLLEKARFDSRFRDNVPEADLEQLETCDLLIIDDLGSEFNTALTNADLFHVVNSRLLTRRSTIISTNLTLRDLSQKYDDRLVSRLAGSYTLLPFYGPDLRYARNTAGPED